MQTKGIIIKGLEELSGVCEFHKPMLCCSSSFKRTSEYTFLCKNFDLTVWDKIRPNPRWEDMLSGAKLFCEEKCDFIIGAGGGSVLDSAKCIKLLATNEATTALTEPMEDNDIPFLAIPTTSGTGSETTKYSIFYVKENEKHSIANEGFLPDYIILDEKFLKTVPMYQRKCTCLDALSHAVESYWNTKSTAESREYAKNAIELFVQHKDAYMKNENAGNKGMLMASYYAGRAINITSTTAAHALCYNVTMNCDTAHGHSVAVILAAQWRYMNKNNAFVNDERGRDYVLKTFDEIAGLLGGAGSEDGARIITELLQEFALEKPCIYRKQLPGFVSKVNMGKLSNNPTRLNEQDITNIYEDALNII